MNIRVVANILFNQLLIIVVPDKLIPRRPVFIFFGHLRLELASTADAASVADESIAVTAKDELRDSTKPRRLLGIFAAEWTGFDHHPKCPLVLVPLLLSRLVVEQELTVVEGWMKLELCSHAPGRGSGLFCILERSEERRVG